MRGVHLVGLVLLVGVSEAASAPASGRAPTRLETMVEELRERHRRRWGGSTGRGSGLLEEVAPAPPPGLSPEELRAWTRAEHVRVLEDVLAGNWSRTTRYFRSLIARLRFHGYEPPMEPHSFYHEYTRRELRSLKDASLEGNITAAVLLADTYRQRSMYDHEPRTLTGGLILLPRMANLASKASDYERRAKKIARRRLRKLRR